MVGQFIDTFWRKSFIGDLRRAKKLPDDDGQWTICLAGKTHQFQFVWLQGLCVKIDQSADLMILEDSTGQAQIQNCSRVQHAWSMKEGESMMVAGKLLQTTISSTQSDRILIDAYRIQTCPMKSEISWPSEVVHINEHVYHLISS